MDENILPQITNTDTDDVDSIIRRNNYKLTADKIKQILSKVLNDPTDSSKRWVWELMQNAKDVPCKQFERISIQIILSEDQLVFKHNGDPFVIPNITGLIQQVSSKDSVNSDVDVTGKFGTGFISTHLLSEIIDVTGIVHHKGKYRKFELQLDRSGKTSEDLLPKIEEALEHIRKIDDDNLFPVFEDYLICRKEDFYDTSFTYHLTSEEKQKAAVSGIDDLINTLPITLVNISKIKRVEVINKIKGSTKTYKSDLFKDLKPVKLVYITVSEEDRKPVLQNFVIYSTNELSLTVEVENFDVMKLKESFGKIPYLYRDFPLIGSENFHFPFILNGFRFNPKDDRDGIFLHGKESNEAIENRKIIENAIVAAQSFSDWLISKNAQNRYICAFTRLPQEKWEEFSKSWYVVLQQKWRQTLLDKLLVKTIYGPEENLRSCVIPNYGETKEVQILFYKIVSPFIGKNKVPGSDSILNWIEAIGPKPELHTWGIKLQYDLEIFLKELEEQKNLNSLQLKLGEGYNVINWLNNLYKFLIDSKETDAFYQLAIIPNQNENLCTLKELSLEDNESPIPDEFLDILSTLGQDWRKEHIKREVVLPNQNIQKRGLSKASEKINEIIKEEEKNTVGVLENKFVKRMDAFSILKDIIRNIETTSTREDFKSKIFFKGKELFGFEDDLRVVKHTKDFKFEHALKLFIQFINSKIESHKTISQLTVSLKKDEPDTIIWLNSYLNVLKAKEDFKILLEHGNIVPNRDSELCALSELFNFGTDDTPLKDDLILILSKLDPKKNLRKKLVLDGIHLQLTPLKFEELGAEIDTALKELEKEEVVNPGSINDFKSSIFDLINWCNTESELAPKFLSYSISRKNDLWVKFSMTDKIFNLLKNEKNVEILEALEKSNISKEQINEFLGFFEELGEIPEKVMRYAKEECRRKREFNNMLEVGSKVERLFIETLKEFKIDSNKEELIHAGGGAYDIRIFNPANNKSFYIELKSVHSNNDAPISIAVSQVKRAVKEKDSFALVIIERSFDNEMDTDYIANNSQYLKNPGQYLHDISNNYDIIESKANTQNEIDLKMDYAEFKGSIEYNWIKEKTNNSGFTKLIEDIKSILNDNNVENN